MSLEFCIIDDLLVCVAKITFLILIIIYRRKVVFLNTDAVPALDSRSGDVIHNEVEAALVHHVCTYVKV